MEISGTLIQILEAQTGIGKNGPWKKQGFVLETKDKFPKKVCVVAWNDAADAVEKLQLGSALKVQFDIESREYNGKWYTDVKAWKVESAGGGNTTPKTDDDDEFFVPSNDENEPLPF